MEQAIAIAKQLNSRLFLYFLHDDLAVMLLMEDKPAEATPLVQRNLLIARRVGEGVERSAWIFCAACCAGRLGPAETAARLHGVADAETTAGRELGTIG